MAFTQDILPKGYENQIVYNFSKNLYSLKKLPFDAEVIYYFCCFCFFKAQTLFILMNKIKNALTKNKNPPGIK